ncbi:hypothetical protein [endosymbiont GvMRE of Glomus versiforme]|uniref:hypothetical protein n=1 Tax=endosymbiont GvMRE of Glomus versiforme TaxID=2039283 RepID=UPI000EED5D0D|nr:hypothetical protein [endosymbiont GvMRE of Glomus versiforme]RHZ37619.1 hypothetical protein GvMRE_I1g34 [endosymbiont GvMRE of Glomus versiforme]
MTKTGDFVDIFDLSNYTNLNNWSWEGKLKRKFYNHYVGISRLEGQGPLKDLWADVEWQMIIQGEIAVIELVENSGEWFLAVVALKDETTKEKKIKRTRGGIESVSFILLDDATKEEINGGNGEKPENIAEKNWIGDRFLIFKNDRSGTPMLGSDFAEMCEDLDNFYQLIKWDAGQAKKRFILILPSKPDDEKWADVVNSWEIGILTLITLLKEPSSKDKGIKMSDIKYDTYADPEQGKQRDQLWRDLYNLLSLIKSFHGIRHINQMDAQDKERQSVPEIYLSSDEFNAWEYLHWHERDKVLREAQKKMKGSKYRLRYGQISEGNF